MRLRSIPRIALPLLAGATAAGAQNEAFVLAPPLDCKFGETSFIQRYFDHDPSKGAKDFSCRPALQELRGELIGGAAPVLTLPADKAAELEQ